MQRKDRLRAFIIILLLLLLGGFAALNWTDEPAKLPASNKAEGFKFVAVEAPPKAAKPAPAQTPAPASEEKNLIVEPAGKGKWVALFRTKSLKGAPRLTMLEYLVTPDRGEKDHECLVVVPKSVWPAVKAAIKFSPSSVDLRWKDKEQRTITRPLSAMLPWASLDASNNDGVLLGGNHDESKNAQLPPDDAEVFIAVHLTDPAQADALQIQQ